MSNRITHRRRAQKQRQKLERYLTGPEQGFAGDVLDLVKDAAPFQTTGR